MKMSANAIAIARETIRITKEKKYQFGTKTVHLPERNYEQVIVYSPEAGDALLAAGIPQPEHAVMCRIQVTTEDSYEAAQQFRNPLVMNFANAHVPGGGFLLGAPTQEEALCRRSTLYASLTSRAAKEMYRCNNLHPDAVESDYMLLSRGVCVFRDAACNFLETPFSASVITIPAPNLRVGAILASKATVSVAVLRRIRIMLCIAAKHGYRNLILGAWGCGAFGHKPDQMAAAFRQVLIEERYGTAFDTVRFAIYGREDGRNYTAFRKVFEADIS